FAPEPVARLEEVPVGLGPDPDHELRGGPGGGGPSWRPWISSNPPSSERLRAIPHPAEQREPVLEALLRRDAVERRLARRLEVVRDAVAQVGKPVDLLGLGARDRLRMKVSRISPAQPEDFDELDH